MKILYAKDIAERLNVSVGTLHKKEFQRRLGLPLDHKGRQLCCPEPILNEFFLKPYEPKSDGQK
ncbi:MAG: hypothetical protein H6755_07810 [Candidatus Omnitrophica bacterium]|nr:hypothetical protein [Candidatus Omnitrophota bacterium]